MARVVVLVLVLAVGCSDESVDDRLNSLDEQTAIHCFDVIGCGNPTVATEQALACMNDALANGTRAQARWEEIDAHGFYTGTYVFTVDHEVKAFRSIPDDFGGPATLREEPSCAGPFKLGGPICVHAQVLAWDGCP